MRRVSLFSFFRSSQLPPPFIFLPLPSSTAQVLLLPPYDQRAVGPVHGIIIFAFVFVVLSLIAFFLFV